VKKIISYILIVITLVQVLAPFSVGLEKNRIEINKNKTEAAGCTVTKVIFNPLTAIPNRRSNEDTSLLLNTTGCIGKFMVNLHIDAAGVGTNAGTTVIKVDRATITNDNPTFKFKTGEYACSGKACDNIVVGFSIVDNITGAILSSYTSNREDKYDRLSYYCTGENGDLPGIDNNCTSKAWEFVSSTGVDQAAAAQTTVSMYYYEITTATETITSKNFPTEAECNASRDQAIANSSMGGSSNAMVGECVEKQVTQTTIGINSNNESQSESEADPLPACFFGSPYSGTIMGCVAQIFYYVLFVPTSYVFALTGTFFDFTFHYSIQDSSYRTPFVVEGWGIVRDMCNMFFIFVLLYIAFGTILNLHSVKTKEMVINVVIIGLLINFSLFATQVMIDASNILARVFYNSDSIKITQGSNSANGVANATPGLKIGPNGEIPLSAAIVNKVNPQNLIINGSKAVKIQDKVSNTETSSADDKNGNLGVGAFILITLLATAVNIVGLIVFLSVGLIFVARVIGLWFAMILSPFVFFSYTVPSLQDMEMVGWKKWWPETLKLAFLAPVFIFFMYLIIAFLEKGLSLVKANDAMDGMSFVISVIVPFIFIMILLMKAKDIAKDMSGKMGQSITNGIAAAGGIALGGAALGAAALGRNVIGGTLAKASRGETSTQKYEEAKRLQLMGDTSAMDKLNWKQKAKGATGKFLGMDKVYGTDKGDFDIKTKKAVGVSGGIGGLLNKKQKEVGEVDHARHIVDEAKDKAGFKDIDYNKLSGTQKAKVQETFVKDNKSKWAQDEEDSFRAARGYDSKKALDPTEVAELKKKISTRADAEFEKELHHAAEKVRGFTRAFTKTNTGSWDVRNLAEIKSDKREGVFTKVPVALIAGVASGVRSGMKNVGVSNGGVKIEGNFMKDLGSTISDSLKSMKVSVDLGHVGETKSSADAHGGGGHH